MKPHLKYVMVILLFNMTVDMFAAHRINRYQLDHFHHTVSSQNLKVIEDRFRDLPSCRINEFYFHFTAIHKAATRETEEALEFLLQNGADIHVQSRDFSSLSQGNVIHKATVSYYHEKRVLSYLLKHYTHLANVRNHAGDGPIHVAAAYKNASKSVQLLLRHNPKLAFSQNRKGNTPLHVAILNRHFYIIRTLLPYSNLSLANYSGLTPTEFALELQNNGPKILFTNVDTEGPQYGEIVQILKIQSNDLYSAAEKLRRINEYWNQITQDRYQKWHFSQRFNIRVYGTR
jgi:ankyrin repeat protein